MKLRTIKLMTSLLFLTLLFNSNAQNISKENYDILIKNGKVIDGTGSIGFSADVLIKDDEIVRVKTTVSAGAASVRLCGNSFRALRHGKAMWSMPE